VTGSLRTHASWIVVCAAAFACSGAPSVGPVEVAWDRDACAHCYMTIGDRRAAAQLRREPGGEVQLFDDLGCALLYLGDGAFTELWVRDASGSRWVDARQARFTNGATTPMDYGFVTMAAEGEGTATGLTLDRVRAAVREIEDERRSARP
jgi:hypothetical protein